MNPKDRKKSHKLYGVSEIPEEPIRTSFSSTIWKRSEIKN